MSIGMTNMLHGLGSFISMSVYRYLISSAMAETTINLNFPLPVSDVP